MGTRGYNCAADTYGPGDRVRLTRTYVVEGIVSTTGVHVDTDSGYSVFLATERVPHTVGGTPPTHTITVLKKAKSQYIDGALYHRSNLTNQPHRDRVFRRVVGGWVTLTGESGFLDNQNDFTWEQVS